MGMTSSISRRTHLACRAGTIRATVLIIETILASFEMDEILYELRDHSARDSIAGAGIIFFSFIKKFQKLSGFSVLPNAGRK